MSTTTLCLGLAMTAALSGGCVTKATYDRTWEELSEARDEATARNREAEALRAEARRLEAEAQRHQAEQMEMKNANAELTHKVDDLMLLNAEFTERLRSAGQNVEQLATERGDLRQALADTRTELAEWRKQQQAIAARTAQQGQLATALSALVTAKRLEVGLRLGRVVVTIPGDDLFDPGKANVKGTGRPTMVQVAGALRALSGRSFRVAAHTDGAQSAPRPSTNWQLTMDRAMSVARELITAGLPAERLSVAAHAEYDPVDSNDAESGRARNRRIEIVLVPLPDELVKPAAAARAAPPAPKATP